MSGFYGYRRVWVKGPRQTIESTDTKGNTVVRRGKNGGPVIDQRVELHLVPKEARS